MIERSALKKEAKQILSNNFWTSFKVLIVPIVLMMLAFFVSYLILGIMSLIILFWGSILFIILCVALIIVSLMIGLFGNSLMMYMYQDLTQDGVLPNSIWKYYLTLMKKYGWQLAKLAILQSVLIMAWSLLLVIPGIIKGYAYAQAIYLLREQVDQGQKVSVTACLKESTQLMIGHKMEFFILQLSFIGWFILASVTLNLSLLYSVPYQALTNVLYYQTLIKQKRLVNGEFILAT